MVSARRELARGWSIDDLAGWDWGGCEAVDMAAATASRRACEAEEGGEEGVARCLLPADCPRPSVCLPAGMAVGLEAMAVAAAGLVSGLVADLEVDSAAAAAAAARSDCAAEEGGEEEGAVHCLLPADCPAGAVSFGGVLWARAAAAASRDCAAVEGEEGDAPAQCPRPSACFPAGVAADTELIHTGAAETGAADTELLKTELVETGAADTELVETDAAETGAGDTADCGITDCAQCPSLGLLRPRQADCPQADCPPADCPPANCTPDCASEAARADCPARPGCQANFPFSILACTTSTRSLGKRETPGDVTRTLGVRKSSVEGAVGSLSGSTLTLMRIVRVAGPSSAETVEASMALLPREG
mmetsp:Transcript_3413/g.8454  ORF Transcript_3413/g.8454 Transcript_3413/m.8454 type:complete len:362 (-) Transcript_3413:784-1869(-)